MAKKHSTHILTANDLLEGHSVYLDAQGRWVVDYRQARVAGTPEEAAALEALGREAEEANQVVGPYLVAVEAAAGDGPEPVHYREKLRVTARPSFWPRAGAFP